MTLPALILYESFGSNYENYISAIYEIFQNDFLNSTPIFRLDPSEVHINSRPYEQNKEHTFWHITTEGKVESDRLTNFRRCERIRYPKFLIENYDSAICKIWEKDISTKKGREKRIHISTNDFSYLVVLSTQTRKDSRIIRTLITAFYVEETYQRKKNEKDYKMYKIL